MKQNKISIFKGLSPQQYLETDMVAQMDRDACLSFLESVFHPDGLACMDCGSGARLGSGRTAKGVQRYRCTQCGTTFTAISHTPFSGTKLGPRKIVLFMWLLGLGCDPQVIGDAVGLLKESAALLVRKVELYAKQVP